MKKGYRNTQEVINKAPSWFWEMVKKDRIKMVEESKFRENLFITKEVK